MARPNTNGNNNNLSPPSLTLNTLVSVLAPLAVVVTMTVTDGGDSDGGCRCIHFAQIPSITHTPGEECSPDRRSTSSRDGNSPLLSPHSPSSLGGETLQQRSRTNSFNSHVETLPPLSRDGSSTMGGDAVQPLVVKDGQEKGSSSTPSPSPSPLPGSKPDYDDVNCEDALEPEERNIADFHVENNPFAFSPGQLNKLLNPKSLAAFQALGGLKGLEKGLRTDLTTGLSIDETHLDGHVSFDEATAAWTPPNTKDARAQQTSQHPADTTRVHDQDHVARFPAENQFVDRIRVYDRNKLPERKTASFFKLFWDAYNDKIIILLTIAAVISLAL
ncbi:plasma membrane calcium, partial [Ascosphaera atra]